MRKLGLLFFAALMVFSLFSCTESDAPADSETPTVSSSDSPSDGASDSPSSDASGDEAEDAFPNQVIAHNNITGILGVYDMSLLSPGDPLEDGLVWSYKGGDGGDIKYREDTVFGDVIVICGSAVGGQMISYPEGKVLWQTNNPGNNPHSIEILPSGNIIIACSTGNSLRLFKTSALLTGDTVTAQRFSEVSLRDAHGVLFDPAYGVVWALGGSELAAYSVTGEGTGEVLSPIGGMGVTLPAQYAGGHDLSADYTDEDFLYLTTGSKVYRFDKDANALVEKFPQYSKLSKNAVKGFSNNPNGNFFYSRVNNGIGTSWEDERFAAWCTDRIHFCYMKTENFMYIREYVSENGAFYKVRAFCGSYQ